MQCPACSEPLGGRLRPPRQLPCGHSVCAPCLLGMEAGPDQPCPQCQRAEQHEAAVQLPDEMWLRVFALLDARTLLLAVRPTCRRWSELALHPLSWANKVLDDSTPLPLLLAVCRTAPCVKLLAVYMPKLSWSALTELAGTSCAASVLGLQVGCASPYMVGAARILQNQLMRGRIHSLRLDVELRGAGAHLQLVQLLTGTERLAAIQLEIKDQVETEAAAPSSALPDTRPLAITRLKYTGARPQPVLRWLLAVSSWSLRHLQLDGALQFHSEPPLAELAECRKVRVAYLPAAAIQAIPPGRWGDLKELTCYAPLASDTLRQAVMDFFSSAAQLDRLEFKLGAGATAGTAAECAVQSVVALASQSQPAPSLTFLKLWFFLGGESSTVLAGALPGLPELRTLEVSLKPLSIAKAFTSRTARRLSLLVLHTYQTDLRDHVSPEIVELVRRSPGVPVLVQGWQPVGGTGKIQRNGTALCGHSTHMECDRSAFNKYGDYTLVSFRP